MPSHPSASPRRAADWSTDGRRRSMTRERLGRVCADFQPIGQVAGAAEGRCARAGVEMPAADDNRRPELTAGDEVIDALAERGAFAVPEPADPGGESLERHALAGEAD